MTTPLFLRRLLVLWCEIWKDKLHIFYFISATVKKSVPFFVIAALEKSPSYMTDTRRIILPYTCKSHGEVRLHFPSKPHLRILGRSSSTQKTTSWPRKFPLRFRTVSQSAWTESKITSNHDDLSQIQVLSRTADRREKAHMAMKCIKRCRNAAWMQESRPRLLHYPLCHILF